jgi:hypothetical protein
MAGQRIHAMLFFSSTYGQDALCTTDVESDEWAIWELNAESCAISL